MWAPPHHCSAWWLYCLRNSTGSLTKSNPQPTSAANGQGTSSCLDMGAQHSSHNQQNPVSQASRWLEGLKLAALTSAVGVLQFVRCQALLITQHIPYSSNGFACLGSLSTGSKLPAALQTFQRCCPEWALCRYQLAQDTRRHESRRAGHSRPSPEDHQLLSPELRRAAINLIDYHLTPLLVDQWR